MSKPVRHSQGTKNAGLGTWTNSGQVGRVYSIIKGTEFLGEFTKKKYAELMPHEVEGAYLYNHRIDCWFLCSYGTLHPLLVEEMPAEIKAVCLLIGLPTQYSKKDHIYVY